MFDWICHNRDVFLMSYVEIGHSYQLAKDIQEDHNHFTMSSMVIFHLFLSILLNTWFSVHIMYLMFLECVCKY